MFVAPAKVEKSMQDVNLLEICLNAFVAVIGLLSLLALSMRALNALLPAVKTSSDAAVAVAINAAVQAMAPGARVTHIESTRNHIEGRS